MGQTKETFIYKFITKNSIEEKMVAIQNRKKELITGAFNIGNEERRRQRIADIRNIFDLNWNSTETEHILLHTIR